MKGLGEGYGPQPDTGIPEPVAGVGEGQSDLVDPETPGTGPEIGTTGGTQIGQNPAEDRSFRETRGNRTEAD